MPLARFVLPLHPSRLRHHTGGLLQLLGATFVIPAVVALALREPVQAGLFTAMSAGSWAIGWVLRRGPTPGLDLREAMVLTAVAYPLFAVVGAVAFAGTAGPVEALFEAMSGFTTTGLTVLDVEDLPSSLLFYRAYTQWVGGAGIIVLSLVVLAGPGSAGAQLYAAEFGERNLLGSVVDTGRVVVVIYAALTVAGTAALLAAGAGFFDAVLHGLSLTSTGGFSPFPDSFGAYDRAWIPAVAGVFMALGATSLPLFYLARQRGWRRVAEDAQLRTLLLVIAVAGVLFALMEGFRISGLGAAAFHVTSAVTTTGFSLEDPAGWSDGSRLLTVGLMAAGGSLGSTAGGLKLLRVLILLRVLGWTISRILLPPDAKVPLKVQHAVVRADEVRHTFALTAAYLGLLFACSLLLTGAGIPMQHALFETASGLSTVGLSVGVTSPELPSWGKLMLAFTMWAGRIEILAILVLAHPRNWRRG